ncbi:MAG: 30S ribosomal protein S12 methylthiotransferase RimO, partial [Dehalococcoidia bacterium]
IGHTLDVNVEGAGEDEDGNEVIVGRSYREAPEVDGLVIARGAAGPGERVSVRIDAAGDYDLLGTVQDGGAGR